MNNFSTLVVVALAGAVLMAVEIVGARILAVTFGSTVFVWGSLLGIFMGTLALGYTLGGRLADRRPDPRILGVLAALAGGLVVPVPLLGYALSDLFAGGILPDSRAFSMMISPIVVMILLFTGPGVAIGMLSPMGIRVLARDAKGLGRVSGRVYGATSLGSIVGALLVVFVLMSVLPNRAILFGAAALLVLAGVARALIPGPVSHPDPEEQTESDSGP